jgi:hypothetical protein
MPAIQAQLQGQWDEAIRPMAPHSMPGDLNPKGRLLIMGLRANALGVRGRTRRRSRASTR